jgi:hypothetical protein
MMDPENGSVEITRFFNVALYSLVSVYQITRCRGQFYQTFEKHDDT